jgi:hypothetical protein
MNSILNFRHTLSSATRLPHLSEVEIDDQLLGELAAAPAAHLAACTHCTARLAEASSPLAAFDTLTLAWSERRSATLPLPDLSQQRPLWQRRIAWATASFACVLGLSLANLSNQVKLRSSDALGSPAASARQVALPSIHLNTNASIAKPQPSQISADNQMLQAVDSELDAVAVTPAALGLEPVSTPATRSAAAISVQD